MAERLEDLLRSCTVRVLGGPMPGAGFFVAPGKVVTCLHLIGDSPALIVRWERDGQPPVEVPVSARALVLADRGRPIPALDRDYPDIAVLEVAGLDGHPCVGIDAEWPAVEDAFQAFGYPQEGGAVQLTPARLSYRGTKGILPTTYLDLASDTVKPGMSGAAVLNLRSGAVCGVVVASKHPAQPDGALAIPWSAIDADLGELLAANRAFHLEDRRWNAAVAAGRAAGVVAAAPGQAAGPAAGTSQVEQAEVRVFISYAQDDQAHEERVRGLWLFLRAQGIDARLDLPAAEQRQDWAQWMTQQIRDADRVLVIASPEYKRRAEGDALPGEGRGVQWESRLIREVFYADQQAGLGRVLPVVLPGYSAGDIPLWLGPTSATRYEVSDYTIAGAESLLRLLTGQPGEIEPALGQIPVLPPRSHAPPAAPLPAAPQPVAGTAVPSEPGAGPDQPGLRTEVVIEAALSEDGVLTSAVWLAGAELCRRQAPLPGEVAEVWGALRLPALAAGDRMAEAGRRLAAALLDDDTQHMLAGMVNRLRPGDTVEVVLAASGPALSLPIELIRLASEAGQESQPLGLLAGVSVARRITAPDHQPGQKAPDAAAPGMRMAGPLKVLAAVAAPDETKTSSVPLDAEAEMQAVLDAVTAVDQPHAQVRILEVASLSAIRRALEHDAYHVLHLSAHGSPEAVELEDEDGHPVLVTPQALMQALRHAGRLVPLIVLSSCSGGATGSVSMAAELITQGADRVIAMLAPVTDPYATILARHLYRELSVHPGVTAGDALARARYLAEEDRRRENNSMAVPQYGVVTLLAAGGDGPLTDPALPEAPLTVVTTPPLGKGVLELPMGALIGRRAQLRATMGVLRRTDAASKQFGLASGVVLTGIGGIGKTALAGRVISRLRDEGWLIAVHEGRWNPTALIDATAAAAGEALSRIGDPTQVAALRQARDRLTDPGSDDGPKLAVVAGLLASQRLLVVFDDFEQNLTPGGEAFLGPAIEEVITGLGDAADTGALLVTCRYPLPGPDLSLAQVRIPPLSAAELRRLFLRLPALAGLDAEDTRLLTRTIGGHPRLIEFTDALLRGGRAAHLSLKHVQTKLRDLARAHNITLERGPTPATAVEQAMVLGSADILLTQLLELLTPGQAEALRQVAVCRAPMTLDDLAFALTPSRQEPGSSGQPDLAALRADAERLTDLTLLTPGEHIVMHPWTADLVTRNAESDLTTQHEQALAMRLRRFEQQRGSYADLIDIPRHLAALHQYDDIPGLAAQVTQILPGTLATVAYLAEICALIPAAQPAWALVADSEVEALLRAGDLPAASRQLQAIHEQDLNRAAANPTNTEWQRNLWVNLNRLGDVAVAAGDLGTARGHYQAGLDIGERLAAADPANTDWQRDLSVSHNRLGNVAVAAGDLATARSHYQASLDSRERLAAADPANTGWQRDLWVSHVKLGEMAVAAGDLATARSHYQAGLDIGERLAADQGSTQWQRDLSVNRNKLGQVAVAAGDLATARSHYQAGLDIAERLAAADPTNTGWQRDLAISHERVGEVARAAGDLATARSHYQASLDSAERLAAADPANIGWQRDLSVSRNKLGDVAVAAGDLGTARSHYQAGLDSAERLTAADPTNTDWQRDLSISHERLGEVAVAAGDLATARSHYQASLDIRERLTAADPANTEWQRDLSVSRNKLGDVARAAGDLATARGHYRASLDIRERLAAADPANTEWQRDLEFVRQRIRSLTDG
jgi:tetratricopeptide (TPR) repeat protein